MVHLPSMLFLLLCLLYPTISFSDCKVVEYKDHSELVCEDTPLSSGEKAVIQKEREEQEIKEKVRQQSELVQKLKEIDSRKDDQDKLFYISNLDSRIIESNKYYSTYSFKFEAHNPGRSGFVFIDIKLYDKKGFEIQNIPLNEFFSENQTKIVTTSRIVDHPFDNWSVTPRGKKVK